MTDVKKKKDENPPVFDYADFLARIDGDVDLLKEVIAIFLEDTPRLLSDLYTAIERDDLVAVERAAHTLKGAAANISACRLYAISQETQQAVKNKNRDLLDRMIGIFEDSFNRLERELRGYVE
jgi:HPt (histidine-containing phosphotransfer) domain-containing protein